jgi:hypothetical protein
MADSKNSASFIALRGATRVAARKLSANVKVVSAQSGRFTVSAPKESSKVTTARSQRRGKKPALPSK